MIISRIKKWTLGALLLATTCASAKDIQVIDQSIATQSRLMAVSLRGEKEIWTSGTDATIYRSLDAGDSWSKITPPENTGGAQFRDIEALNNGVVIVMSAGEGKASNVYRSADNGVSWTRVVQADHPNSFFDCVSFVDEQTGWLYGDAIDGQLFVLKTIDGGTSWLRQQLPFSALEGEGGFASSGTCVSSLSEEMIFIGTGNGDSARLLMKQQQWRAIDSPFKAGEAAGIFSLRGEGNNLYLAGGSLKTEDAPAQVYHYDLTNGAWTDMGNPLLKGAVYGSATLKDVLFVSNPQGISVYRTGSKSWQKIASSDIWALACNGESSCWGVGAAGNVRQMVLSQ